MSEQEVWKVIEEYPKYQISNFGNVKGALGRVLKGRQTKSGHLAVQISGGNKEIHRLIARGFLPNPEGLSCVDHIDCNPTNNMVSNLRWCSKSQNGMNRLKHINNTTGYKGVRKNKNKFQSEITSSGKRFHLGTFNTAEEAFEAYKLKAIELHGVFAKY